MQVKTIIIAKRFLYRLKNKQKNDQKIIKEIDIA
jgi:hypothetical protein